MKRLAEKIKPYLQLLRIGNLAFLAILLYVMEKWVAMPLLQAEKFQELMPWWVLTLLILSVVCIAAGGYVINDYFDVKIDRINRPDDMVVTRVISRDAAMHIFYALTAVGLGAGVAVAWWAYSWTLLFTYVIIPGLLWFYSASYKRMFLVGNLVVAFASAIVPLLVAIANADYLHHLYQDALTYSPIVGKLYVWTGGFAAFAFLLTWAREMVKDIEDIEGDCEMECRTVPIVWGEKNAKIFVTVLLMAIAALIAYMLLAILPFPHEWKSLPTRYVLFGLIVPILCTIVLLWAANNRTELHRVQTIIKFTMFMGVLFSFIIATYL
ncbi:MAG: geranylgeranylglycerol-phosphate geranylgeranyltransferase [Paludibacteraceae bacterium]|nr:geranylgeranylglycerol-phosphate geranylgeranyltransferase [Paludibacteraceae bacterium]